MAKYRIVKPITPQSMLQAQWNMECNEFWQEFELFLHFHNYYTGLSTNEFETALLFKLEDGKNHKWVEFFLRHNFIEKVEDKVYYKIGDVFEYVNKKGKYLLTKVIHEKLMLIVRIDGYNRGYVVCSKAVEFKNENKITLSELLKLSNQFEKLKLVNGERGDNG